MLYKNILLLKNLSIVLCITKFQDNLFNKTFLLKMDCKVAKNILKKDVQNLASKYIFAIWQALLSCFDFEIQHIEGKNNALPNFLTRKFLQRGSKDGKETKREM